MVVVVVIVAEHVSSSTLVACFDDTQHYSFILSTFTSLLFFTA